MLGHSQLATTPVPCSRGHPWPQSRRWHSTDSHQPSQVSPSHRSAWLGSAVPPCCVTGSGLGGTAVLLCPSSHLGDSAPSLGTAQRSEGDSFHPGTLWVPHWGCWLSSETQNKAQMLPLGDVNPVAVNPPGQGHLCTAHRPWSTALLQLCRCSGKQLLLLRHLALLDLFAHYLHKCDFD